MGWTRQQGQRRDDTLYLHGDVCDGGGSQVEVLLDQNVKFGGKVPPGPNAVDLAGEQRGDLKTATGVIRRNNKDDKNEAVPRRFTPTSFFGRSETRVSSPWG